jgi:hypothetical protein
MRQALYQVFCSPPCSTLISNSPNHISISKSDAAATEVLRSNDVHSNGTIILSHEDLEMLLTAGGGVQNTRAHCLRLASLKKSFKCAQDLANAFQETLEIDSEDETEIRKVLSNDVCSLWANLSQEERTNLFINLTAKDMAQLLHVAGDFMTLFAYIHEFESRHRHFSNIKELRDAIEYSIKSGSYYTYTMAAELIKYIYCDSTLLSSTALVGAAGISGSLMISGKLVDDMISCVGTVESVISHLKKIESVGRSFKNIAELSNSVREAVELSFHSSAEMRTSLLSSLSSSSCDLIDKTKKEWSENADSIIDLILQISGGLQPALQHLHTFQQLRMRFVHIAQLCPAISLAIRTNVHSTKVMQQAITSYLTAAECRLLQDPNCLANVRPIELEDLLLSGGGVLNTLKHLQRLNESEHRCSSIRELSEALRVARRTRLYYPSTTRSALGLYLNTIHGLLSNKNGTTLPCAISDRDCERLLKYGGGFTSTFHILHDLNAANKRFHSILDLFAIIKRIKSYDERVRTSHRPRVPDNRKRITVNERQQVIGLLSSTLLFSENESSFTVKSDEVDELIQAGGDVSSTCLALRKFNSEGRRFIGMADLTVAVAAARGPIITISLKAEDRDRLLQSLSWPQCTLFSESRLPIRITETELCRLVMLSDGSVDRALHHLSQFSRASRRFSALPHLLDAVQQSQRTLLYATDEARLFVLDCIQNPACLLFSNRQIGAQLTIVSIEIDQCILIAGNASACVWHLQSMDEAGERFETAAALLSDLQKSVSSSPQMFPYRNNSSMISDRNALFQILSTASSKLFEATDKELSISSSAFDCFLSRVRGLDRAKSIIRGLEVRERRFLSFGHLFWSVCKVRDNGQSIADAESWGLEDGFSQINEEDEDIDDEEPANTTGYERKENHFRLANIPLPSQQLQSQLQRLPKPILHLTQSNQFLSKHPASTVGGNITTPTTTGISSPPFIPILHNKDLINALDNQILPFEESCSSLSYTLTSEFSTLNN